MNKTIDTDFTDLSNKDFSTFNDKLTVMVKKIEQIENVEYAKMEDLRKKNKKLSIIQNHIKNLKKENEEIEEEITNNKFNLLEKHAIIVSYERNIVEREKILEDKKAEANNKDLMSQELNDNIENILYELIDVQNEIERKEYINEENS